MLVSAKWINPLGIGVNVSNGVGVIDVDIESVETTTKRFNFAGIGEAGLGYNLKGNFWLTSSLTYQHDFSRIDKVNYSGDITLHGMTLCLGVKWALKKE